MLHLWSQSFAIHKWTVWKIQNFTMCLAWYIYWPMRCRRLNFTRLVINSTIFKYFLLDIPEEWHFNRMPQGHYQTHCHSTFYFHHSHLSLKLSSLLLKCSAHLSVHTDAVCQLSLLVKRDMGTNTSMSESLILREWQLVKAVAWA